MTEENKVQRITITLEEGRLHYHIDGMDTIAALGLLELTKTLVIKDMKVDDGG